MGSKSNPGAYDCWSKAEPDEPMFVILGRDMMGEQLVLMWAAGAEMRLKARVEASTIDVLDQEAETAKIAEARACAAAMAAWCRSKGKTPMRWQPKGAVIERVAPKTAITRKQVDAVVSGEAPMTFDLLLELARAAGVPE